jgi:hypothetical protein
VKLVIAVVGLVMGMVILIISSIAAFLGGVMLGQKMSEDEPKLRYRRTRGTEPTTTPEEPQLP